MYYVTVAYPNREDVKFDFEYYMTKHIPMVSELLNTTIDVSKGIATPTGAAAPFLCTARIRVDSLDEYRAAIARHGAQILGDIPNYSNVQPNVQIDEVL